MFQRGGGGVKGLLNNVQKNCTFLSCRLPLEEIPPHWRRLKVLFYSNLFGMAVRNWICVHRKSLESLELNLICNYETFGKLHAWCINLTTHRDRL